MARIDHDIETYPESEGGAAIPALPPGEIQEVKAELTHSELVQNSNRTGNVLKLEFTAISPYKGQKVWANLNIKHTSAKAQEIGRGQLTQLCKAVGKSGIVEDSLELHNIPLSILIRGVVGSGMHAPKNEVIKYMPYKSKPPAPADSMYDLADQPALNENVSFDDDEIPF